MKQQYKSLLLALCISIGFSAQRASAQVTFTSWIHPPEITVYAADASAGIGTSAYVTVDDAFSDSVNMGFTFNFYGVPYTQCVIGANGNLSFNLANANAWDSWIIDTPLLGNTTLLNSICGPFADMDIVFGGQLAYFEFGTAPNRQFVVSYCHDAMFTDSLCPGDNTTTQIILYEGTNVIEAHIAHNSACTAWNGGHAIVGVQNADGTAATAAPGRDYPAVWLTSNEAWQFTPDGTGSSYTVASIPYAPVPYYTVYWYDSTTGNFLGTGDSIVLTPTTPTSYLALAMACGDTGVTGLDTAGSGFVALVPPNPTGLNNLTSVHNIAVFPNPAHDVLYITSDEAINDVTVINTIEQTMYSNKCSTKQAQVNTAALPPGIYMVKINGSVMKKFLKE